MIPGMIFSLSFLYLGVDKQAAPYIDAYHTGREATAILYLLELEKKRSVSFGPTF